MPFVDSMNYFPVCITAYVDVDHWFYLCVVWCWYIFLVIIKEEGVDIGDKICLVLSFACLSLDFHAIPCFILHIPRKVR